MLTRTFSFIFSIKALKNFIILTVCLIWAALAVSQAWAQEEQIQPETTTETILIADMAPDITVKLEGEALDGTGVHQDTDGNLYINAIPIFNALNNDFEFDSEQNALVVRRSQDGVVMELYTDTGIVKANGRALGKLSSFGEVSADKFILTPNAISVLTGAQGDFDPERKEFIFELDPRLKVATGFEIFVNDVALGQLNPAPKSVGPVLLLPLLPIAEALGHDVTVIEGGNVVRVRRTQDSAVFTLDMTTGLVKLRDRPYGITKDVNYIDPVNLLLPFNAIETLTGTHVSVEGGSTRIDIALDERLDGVIAPEAKVKDVTKNTPFTPERLSFHLGPDTLNTVTGDFRVSQIGGQIRYEIPDLPGNAKEAEPSWLSLDFAHADGYRGSVGDYSADFRELDGVGLRRVRGVSVHKDIKKGRVAAVIGAPATGARSISEDQSRLTFAGQAAGVRFASREGWEAGLSAYNDTLNDDQKAVLSAISGRLGREKDRKFQWDVRADMGYFNGPARENAVDVRTDVLARYDVSENVVVDGFVSYDGKEFLRSRLDTEDLNQSITDQVDPTNAESEEFEAAPDIRVRGLDQADIGGSIRFTPRTEIGPFDHPALSLRAQHTESGVLSNSKAGTTLDVFGLSAATNIRGTGLSVSGDVSFFDQKNKDGSEDLSGHRLGLRAYKRFKNISTRAQYTRSEEDGKDTVENGSLTVSASHFNLPLSKGAHLNASPSGSLIWNGEDVTARGGLMANLHSGSWFGEKTKVDASLGILQSFDPKRESRTDKFLTVTVGRRIALGNNMAVGLSYQNNLQGNQRVGLVLDGTFDFNEKRKFTNTEKGRGVLKGQAFLDTNRDGQQQDDERGIGGALVRIKGTRLALKTDRAGFFTIQNLKEGLYEVQIDGKSLPLGYALSDDILTKVTISDGFITDIPLPIVQRGQIRGFAFEDSDNDGEYSSGEQRIEGAKIVLKSKTSGEVLHRLTTTSFGQYAFDDLPNDDYEIHVVPIKSLGISEGDPVVIDLGEFEDLLARRNIPLVIKRETRLAMIQPGQPPPQSNTMVSSP